MYDVTFKWKSEPNPTLAAMFIFNKSIQFI